MGRHSTSPAVLRARGSFAGRPSSDPGDGVLNTSPVGAAPDHLTKTQQTVWREMIVDAPEGVLSAAERPILADYCRLEAQLREYETRTAAGEELKAPSAAIYAAKRAILSAFGMLPADRHRVGVAPARGFSDFDDL
jgi:hypothetical protein